MQESRRFKDHVIIAHSLGLDPVTVVRERNRDNRAIRLAAHNVIAAEKDRQAKAAKAKKH